MIRGQGNVTVRSGNRFPRNVEAALAPSLSYFFTSRLAAGVGLSAGYIPVGVQTRNYYYIGLQPTVRYYLQDNRKWWPFLQAEIDYGRQGGELVDIRTGSITPYSLRYLRSRTGAGITWFLNKHVGLDGWVYGDYLFPIDNRPTGTLDVHLRFGFIMILDPLPPLE
ncbi:MAG: hypothetical protein OHK0039_39950 [Bacteroidia bacterium]